jgi:C4-dicarboxylate-specific signal transduction histidine kinase
MFDADGRFLDYRGISSDVTATARTEQVEIALHLAQAELARVARVTALGELAASIAHEVNQPLAAIGADANACLHWLAADIPDLDSVRESLAAIVKDTDRAGAVIAGIRALLARSPLSYEPCDLTAVVRDVLSLIAAEIARHGIRVQTSLAPNVPRVVGNRIQLQQVVLNLLMNGVEAMREVPLERRRMVLRATGDDRDDGLWAIVAVEDGGVGFGGTEALQLFDAFYTTKPDGLGMGLSISRSIVESHNGRIWATANAEHGATFHLALPGMR